MNVAIYIRVSTQEQKQHGISVEAQDAACREWVREHGHHLTGVYNDAGLSARAKYKKRTAMLRLISDIRAGKVDLVVFTKLDRWFRNVADYYEVQAILEQHNVKWRAIQEDYETETASGRFKVNIMLAVAQDEADRTSERIKSAAYYKKQKGEAIGRPALGYRIEDKHFVFDPEKQAGMEAFFSEYLRSFSQRRAMAVALEHGIRLNQTHCGRILRNPTYAGDAFGTPCPAYITQEQFKTIRKHAEARTRTGRSGRVYIFSGMLTCGLCGGAMTSGAAPQRDGQRYIKYYRCCNHIQNPGTCPEGTYVNEEKLEQFLLDHLEQLSESYSAQWRESHAHQIDHASEIRSLTGRLERMRELYIDGELTRESYDTRSAKLKAQIASLQADSSEDPPEPLSLPADWKETYLIMSDTSKTSFWHHNLKRITIHKETPPTVQF